MTAANPSPIITGESELPEGWVSSHFPDVCQINPPKIPLDALEPEQPVTFVPMPAVDADQGAITAPQERQFSEVRRGFTSFQDGDVIMAKITPCMENGKAAIARGLINGLGFGSTEFHVLRPKGAVLPEFVYYFIRQESFRQTAESEMTGSVGQKRVPAAFLKNSELPLPPLAEQERIVQKIEQLLARVNAARERLARVPVILKRFRQAVLAAACSGRLTADWRDANADVEPAHDFLKRIEEQRLKAVELGKLRQQVVDAFRSIGERDAEREGESEEVPCTWAVCRIGMIGSVSNGSTPSRQHPEFWNGDIRWVSSGEVRNNILSETRERMTERGYESCSVRLLPAGTVLIAMIGEGKTRGQTAILTVEATVNQNIAAITLEHGLVSAEYLWYWLQSQYEATRQEGGGTGPRALNCQRVRELPFMLPPLNEQREIVRRIDALFKVADATENKVAAASVQAEKLTQAILAKAFRGELVPTEAELGRRENRSYEPASELLARIQAVHQQDDVTKQKRTITRATVRANNGRPARTK